MEHRFKASARVVLSLAVAFGLAGCATVRTPSFDDGAWDVSVRIVDDLGASASLDRVVVTIDGAPLPVLAVPNAKAAANGPRVATTVRLAPGDHKLDVGAGARRSNQVAMVSSQQALHLATRAGRERKAALVVHVHSPRADAVDPAATIALDVEATNATLGPGLARSTDVASADPNERCGGTTTLRKALCRATTSYDEATRVRDAARMLCIGDKLDRLRDLADIADDARAHGRDTAALAEREALTVAGAIDRCAPATADD